MDNRFFEHPILNSPYEYRPGIGNYMIRKSLEAARAASESKLSILETEWEQIVDAWQLERWEDYRDVPRLGRRTRLKDSQSFDLWRR